jgi:hypothetical protein
MRFYFDVVLNGDRARDEEGSEFEDFALVLVEADQTARDIAAEELLNGRTISAASRIEVLDGQGSVLARRGLREVVLGEIEDAASASQLDSRAESVEQSGRGGDGD